MSDWDDWYRNKTQEQALKMASAGEAMRKGGVGKPTKSSRYLRDMYTMYGVVEDHTCGECKHCRALKMAGTYYKCELTRLTHGAATDWRKRWLACGKFESEEK